MQRIRERVAEHRRLEHDIDPILANRWSPRSMTGEPLADGEFLPLFEATRWAPSSRNEQPWRFLCATRDSDHREAFLELLYSKNREWARDAAVLAVIRSKTTFEYDGSHNGTHAFDTGAAWGTLALEEARRGPAVHAMAGFDAERAVVELHVPGTHEVRAMVAIGEHAPEEERPNGREPLEQSLIEGGFAEVSGR